MHSSWPGPGGACMTHVGAAGGGTGMPGVHPEVLLWSLSALGRRLRTRAFSGFVELRHPMRHSHARVTDVMHSSRTSPGGASVAHVGAASGGTGMPGVHPEVLLRSLSALGHRLRTRAFGGFVELRHPVRHSHARVTDVMHSSRTSPGGACVAHVGAASGGTGMPGVHP